MDNFNDQEHGSSEGYSNIIVWSPLEVLRSNISDGAYRMYVEIAGLANGPGGYCWARNKYLAHIRKVSEKTVERMISELSEAGFLKIVYENNDCSKRKMYPNRAPNTPPTKASTPPDKSVAPPPDKSVGAYTKIYSIESSTTSASAHEAKTESKLPSIETPGMDLPLSLEVEKTSETNPNPPVAAAPPSGDPNFDGMEIYDAEQYFKPRDGNRYTTAEVAHNLRRWLASPEQTNITIATGRWKGSEKELLEFVDKFAAGTEQYGYRLGSLLSLLSKFHSWLQRENTYYKIKPGEFNPTTFWAKVRSLSKLNPREGEMIGKKSGEDIERWAKKFLSQVEAKDTLRQFDGLNGDDLACILFKFVVHQKYTELSDCLKRVAEERYFARTYTRLFDAILKASEPKPVFNYDKNQY